jgi:hydroxymethylglutaryl-CoA synthase
MIEKSFADRGSRAAGGIAEKEHSVAGILAYGAYVPPGRLDRLSIGATLGQPAGRGTRSVASHDEDSTTLGVEAARVALRRAAAVAPGRVVFSTATPTYVDRTNAAAIHAALNLDPGTAAYDFGGAPRSSIGALTTALDGTETPLVVAADIRTGLPGSADEISGGDAGVAFLIGPGPAVAELVASAAVTAEFLDRWRVPGQRHSRLWEDRFGQASYLPPAQQAVEHVLKSAGVAREDVAAVVVAGMHERARGAVAKSLGATASPVSETVGNPGTAQPGLLLAEALDNAKPGDVILVVTLAEGADALLLRATDAIEKSRTWPLLAQTVTQGTREIPYPTFLTWRGMLDREPPRRPDPEPPSPPVSARHAAWKFAFVAGACASCGTRHLPALQTCMSCGHAGDMEPVPLSDTNGSVVTYTVDRLTYSLSPPVIAVVIDFDGGGRFQTELTDSSADDVAIGDRVEMTFRRFFQASNGIANYFWKARPVTEEVG